MRCIFALQATIFFFQCGLMPFAWKGFLTMLCQLSAPPMYGRIGDAQLASDLCNGFTAGLGQPHCFLFEFKARRLFELFPCLIPFPSLT
jgi:hypothetical protein